MSVFHPHHVHSSLWHRSKRKKSSYLEVPSEKDLENTFSYLRFVDGGISPIEHQRLAFSIAERTERARQTSKREEILNLEKIFDDKENPRHLFNIVPTKGMITNRSWPTDLLFTGRTRSLSGHSDVRICSMKETMAHRLIRTRNDAKNKKKKDICDSKKGGSLLKTEDEEDSESAILPAIAFVEREPTVLTCQPVDLPPFLYGSCPSVAASCRIPYSYDRQAQYRASDHEAAGREIVTMGWEGAALNKDEVNKSFTRVWAEEEGGLWAARPKHGFSNVLIPDKFSLISDSGKLHALDGLLSRLKKDPGRKVLVYSQMTKMIDLLEEFMYYRK